MKSFFFIILPVIFLSCDTTDPNENIVDFFFTDVWCAENYSSECSGHEFLADSEVVLYGKSLDFSGFGSVDSLGISGRPTFEGLSMDRTIVTDAQTPKRDREHGYYFLRFSPVYKSGDRLYQFAWIKGDYYTSGYYYTVDVTDKGNYQLVKITRTCDNWG